VAPPPDVVHIVVAVVVAGVGLICAYHDGLGSLGIQKAFNQWTNQPLINTSTLLHTYAQYTKLYRRR